MLYQKLTAVCLLVLLSIFYRPTLRAQEVLHYRDIYQVSGYNGEGDFDFYLQENDTIFQGKFKLHSADLKALLSANGDEYFSFNGRFDQNIPVGFWKFQFGKFVASNEQSQLADHQYRVAVNGVEHQAYGQLVNGRPDGEWIQLVQQIEKSKVKENLFKSTLRFDNGIPQQSFRIESSEMTLMGRFLRDGLAHDVWELYSTETPDVAESWYFIEGRLDKIVISRNTTKEILKAYTRKIENADVITLDARYLQVIKLNQRLLADSPVILEGHMQSLLSENVKYYSKIEKILSSLGKTEFMPAFKVKAKHYPLSEQELQILTSIEELYEKSREISRTLLESSQLNILQLADQETLVNLLITKYINDNHLSLLQEVIEYRDQGVLEYLPRQNPLLKLWAGEPIDNSFIVHNEENDSTYTFSGLNNIQYDFKQDGLIGIKQLAGYTYTNLDSIQEILNRKLKIEAGEQELVNLEEELISQMNELNASIDSLNTMHSEEIKEVLNQIKSSAKSALSIYSKNENPVNKTEDAKRLVTCFDNLDSLSYSISSLPKQREEINKKYTDDVWNPFTSTVMEEQLKKRITDAYNDILIPYFLNQTKRDDLCSRSAELAVLIDMTYQRMLELAEEDTDKLERKLRRENDPMDILQLMGVSSTVKTPEQ